ncbi:MAG: hypothetical protein KDA24_30110 [Deltaproteobacteria bacterium]|nr:hypothetical protein [Deltaproteobacteria bacterium]
MAGNTWAKRQKEKQRRERKEAKQRRRDDRRADAAEPAEEGPTNEELMEQFAELNREHASGDIDEVTFKARRNEIWIAMGLPADE